MKYSFQFVDLDKTPWGLNLLVSGINHISNTNTLWYASTLHPTICICRNLNPEWWCSSDAVNPILNSHTVSIFSNCTCWWCWVWYWWSKPWLLTLVDYNWAHCNIVWLDHSQPIGRGGFFTDNITSCKLTRDKVIFYVKHHYYFCM